MWSERGVCIRAGVYRPMRRGIFLIQDTDACLCPFLPRRLSGLSFDPGSADTRANWEGSLRGPTFWVPERELTCEALLKKPTISVSVSSQFALLTIIGYCIFSVFPEAHDTSVAA